MLCLCFIHLKMAVVLLQSYNDKMTLHKDCYNYLYNKQNNIVVIFILVKLRQPSYLFYNKLEPKLLCVGSPLGYTQKLSLPLYKMVMMKWLWFC